MVVCPLCEHSQAYAGECEVCGKRLAGPGLAAAPVEPLAGLELTRSAPVEVPIERLADLETTTHQPAGRVGAEPVDWLEATGAAVVAVGDVEPFPGLEHHFAEPIPGGDPEPGAGVVCRYCRTAAVPDQRFCDGCGMSLQSPRPPRPEPVGDLEGRCSDCGAMVSGSRCRSCGARLAEPAAP